MHCIHIFSTVDKKVEWRRNPRVQGDETANRSNRVSVVVTGTYLELPEGRYTAQRERALQQLSQCTGWCQTPLAQRRQHAGYISIEIVFFRIDILNPGVDRVPGRKVGERGVYRRGTCTIDTPQPQLSLAFCASSRILACLCFMCGRPPWTVAGRVDHSAQPYGALGLDFNGTAIADSGDRLGVLPNNLTSSRRRIDH
jgi:hypothetical protein